MVSLDQVYFGKGLTTMQRWSEVLYMWDWVKCQVPSWHLVVDSPQSDVNLQGALEQFAKRKPMDWTRGVPEYPAKSQRCTNISVHHLEHSAPRTFGHWSCWTMAGQSGIYLPPDLYRLFHTVAWSYSPKGHFHWIRSARPYIRLDNALRCSNNYYH